MDFVDGVEKENRVVVRLRAMVDAARNMSVAIRASSVSMREAGESAKAFGEQVRKMKRFQAKPRAFRGAKARRERGFF